MTEAEQEIPRTTANALHDVLASVRSEPGPLTTAWQQALGINSTNSAAFARSHGEVMALLVETIDEIDGLDSDSSKKRMAKYIPAWWSAVATPFVDWNNNSFKPREIITDTDLDMLATLGDLVTAQMGTSGSMPVQSDLQLLRAECESWISLVEISNEITDESFRRTLRTQISHLIWLVEQAPIYGLTPVVRQGDQVTGTLVRGTTRQGSLKNSGVMRDRISKFITILTLVANLIHSSQTVFDDVEHSLPDAQRLFKEITTGHPNGSDTQTSSSSTRERRRGPGRSD